MNNYTSYHEHHLLSHQAALSSLSSSFCFWLSHKDRHTSRKTTNQTTRRGEEMRAKLERKERERGKQRERERGTIYIRPYLYLPNSTRTALPPPFPPSRKKKTPPTHSQTPSPLSALDKVNSVDLFATNLPL